MENFPSEQKQSLYRRALKVFGKDNQILKTVEELNELATAFLHYRARPSDHYFAMLCEEYADTIIMLDQMDMVLSLNRMSQPDTKRKLQRLERRVEKLEQGESSC